MTDCRPDRARSLDRTLQAWAAYLSTAERPLTAPGRLSFLLTQGGGGHARGGEVEAIGHKRLPRPERMRLSSEEARLETASLTGLSLSFERLHGDPPRAGGWLSLAYGEPLWIECFLRALPVTLELAWAGGDGDPPPFVLPGLTLSEVGLPRCRRRQGIVRCDVRLAGSDGTELAGVASQPTIPPHLPA